jgi:hypothetical protein
LTPSFKKKNNNEKLIYTLPNTTADKRDHFEVWTFSLSKFQISTLTGGKTVP